MRIGTALIARGIARSGSFASPALMPITSMPPYAKITTDSDATRPPTPFGRKPPCDHRFASDGAPPLPSLIPVKRIAAPPPIIATIAPTLTIDSQNSSSPNTFTWQRFSPQMIATIASTQIHCGTCGNQKPM